MSFLVYRSLSPNYSTPIRKVRGPLHHSAPVDLIKSGQSGRILFSAFLSGEHCYSSNSKSPISYSPNKWFSNKDELPIKYNKMLLWQEIDHVLFSLSFIFKFHAFASVWFSSIFWLNGCKMKFTLTLQTANMKIIFSLHAQTFPNVHFSQFFHFFPLFETVFRYPLLVTTLFL